MSAMSNDPVYRALGEHPDIELAVTPLPTGRGFWLSEQRVILVDSRLSRRHRRCIVAHELEHALAGDDGCDGTLDDHYFRCRMERRASRRAARRLITVAALAEAVALYRDDDAQVAEHLDVDIATLDTRRLSLLPDEWRQLHARLSRLEIPA